MRKKIVLSVLLVMCVMVTLNIVNANDMLNSIINYGTNFANKR